MGYLSVNEYRQVHYLRPPYSGGVLDGIGNPPSVIVAVSRGNVNPGVIVSLTGDCIIW